MFFTKKNENQNEVGATNEMTVDMERIPKHIAIIMDGNGRFAEKKNLPRQMGHKAGALALEKIVDSANKLGIEHLTVYAFSTENWKRSEEEISALMNILRDYCSRFLEQFLSDDIGIHIIGDVSRLDFDIQEMLKKLETESIGKTGMTVHIALNYGGRDELLRGIKTLAKRVEEGTLSSAEITEEVIANSLDTHDVPDPELLIRTSGEERISNFLLWQIAYSEIYFTDELWPEFDETSLLKAIIAYQNRSRRFGGR